jgi:hypothetical protein
MLNQQFPARFPLDSVRFETLQSRLTASKASGTALQDAKMLENDTIILGISLIAEPDVTYFGENRVELVPKSVLDSSYLNLYSRKNSQKPIHRLPLREVINMTKIFGYAPLFWQDVNFSKSTITCDNESEFSQNEGKAYELGVYFVLNNDRPTVI